jgi:hypothetical protein
MSETAAYLAEKAGRRTEAMVSVGVLRLCDVCGRPFRPRSDRNVYCGFKCRQEANRYRARMRARRLHGKRDDA